jgi:hypothetical protein
MFLGRKFVQAESDTTFEAAECAGGWVSKESEICPLRYS